jgi:hypothetical protein
MQRSASAGQATDGLQGGTADVCFTAPWPRASGQCCSNHWRGEDIAPAAGCACRGARDLPVDCALRGVG